MVSAMGCGLSRPWRRRPREASVQSIRPLPESSDGEEETPLLLAVREELCDKAADEPEIHGRSAICPAGSGAFALKVCGLLGLALAIVAAVVLRREPLGKEFHILHAKMVDLGNLRRFAPGPCFTDQMRKIMEWAILTCGEHCTQLLLCAMLLLALFRLKKCSESVAEFVVRRFAGEDLDQVEIERFFAKAEVAQMGLLWMADMLSDVYVTYKYCKQKMYVFALLMILIWLGSGCVAFGHRYVSWERCRPDANIDYWASGLNKHGEPKPDFKSFVLYVAQIQPVVMAWDGWLHGMTRHLREEKMLGPALSMTPGQGPSMSQPCSMSKSLKRRSGTAGLSSAAVTSALGEQAAGAAVPSAASIGPAAVVASAAAAERGVAGEKPESEIQNPWNRFQRQNRQKGWSPVVMAAMYHSSRQSGTKP